ncbi:LCP family glycopolymer transferase [Aquibacillus rhizosphaerae]|uniref:LCP family protein n=1 Tax=Aquibacillus rhizosphaerae TaxID=3051431 RepID=A0ABT7L9V9_9BACI|nr:LCP family protein [Aquibacillus sp. LR5S19]MDL4842656.1 LCP family protein [Aquibacillus sp. LR5S19]
MTEKKRNKSKKPMKLWLKITLITVLVIALGGAGFVYSIYNDAKQTVDGKIHQQVTTIDTTLTKKKIKDEKPLNILLLGVDQRGDDAGRSDALMVLSLDPQNDSMQLVSIPRDTRTEIVGRGNQDKINHAYAFGGVDMTIDTVENLLEIDLDYYVSMNMEGLSDMVNAVGGITVDNQLDWVDTGYYEEGFHYASGTLELNGPQTMGYVRMRYQDPNGDFGRTARQRQVIKAIVDEGASIGSVNKIGDMIDVLGDNVVTNMDFSDMQNLLLNYGNTRNNMVSYMMQGQGTKIDGIYYLVVSDDEIQKVHDMIKKVKS